ncbi:MAG: hypothetical protein Q9M92_11705 [Enterobacterales bacterium]|nr:hypothetical protein [Enterobacterales bacterium]
MRWLVVTGSIERLVVVYQSIALAFCISGDRSPIQIKVVNPTVRAIVNSQSRIDMYQYSSRREQSQLASNAPLSPQVDWQTQSNQS